MNKFFLYFVSIIVFCTLSFSQNNDKSKGNDNKIEPIINSAIKARLIGPAMTSGRISDIAIHPDDKKTWYIAVASGGVWKTTNSGTSFKPIFDNYGSYSIGCVVVANKNKNIVFVGTGENNSQRSVGYGDGLYKSTDAGVSFKNIGLKNSEHIGKIVFHPNNDNIIYVAVQGALWGDSEERGLFKTTDGGSTWEKILYISPMTGVTDVVINAKNPNILYAASYQRRRHVWTMINGGPEAAIYKSIDGGKTWEKLSNGLPMGDVGRIGLAISPIDNDVVYAIIEANEGNGGFYRTDNAGVTWSKVNSYFSGSAQYYHEIYCDPNIFDLVYSMDTYSKYSYNGGKTWDNVSLSERHVDDHTIWIDPDDSDHILIGGDGGLYESFDRAKTFKFFGNLPVTQFYRIEADNDSPFYNVYGGTQDNNSIGGKSRTAHPGGILNQDWWYVVGGDGYEPQIDPDNPNIVYGQWQYGNLIRYDKKSGEITGIMPQPEENMEIRWNWDTPVIISPHNSKRLYIASNYVFRTDNRGDSWTRISDDISRKINRDELPVMGKVWGPEAVAKSASTSLFGNSISLAESPKQENLLYVGTDDGLIQVTEDAGKSWTKYDKFPTVPETTYVSDIYPSRHTANTVYALFNNFKNNDFKPYILKSDNKGKSWKSISSNLPDNSPLWTVEEDINNPNILYLGTEFGLYVTLDGGNKWLKMNVGIPTIAVRDLDIQERENDLVIGTFGRGIYIIDDLNPLYEINNNLTNKVAHIFKMEDAKMFIEDNSSSRRNEGNNFYRASNPPIGITFKYYIKDGFKSAKQKRLDLSKELTDKKEPVPYPTFEQLKLEDEEIQPYLLFRIRDNDNNIVRLLTSAINSGTNQIVWDMKTMSSQPTQSISNNNDFSGFLVAPGQYSVSMSLIENGKESELVSPINFNLLPLNNVTLATDNRKELVDFQDKLLRLYSAIDAANRFKDELHKRVELIQKSLKITPNVSIELINQASNIKAKLNKIHDIINGDASRSRRNANQPMALRERIEYALFTTSYSTSEPTETNRKAYEISSNSLRQVLYDLKNLYENDVLTLEKQMDNILSPWTPGRIPVWKE